MHIPDRKTGWGPLSGLLLISLGLNLALAAAAVHLLAKPAARSFTSVTNLLVVTVQTQQPSATDLPATVVYVTNRFDWRQVESTNYEDYVANLRAIGCPERTLRDILLADVGKFYRQRRLALRQKERFWAAGKQRRIASAAQANGLAALDQEQSALLHRLIGVEWFNDESKFVNTGHLEEQAIFRFILGPIPEEPLQRAELVFERYAWQRSELARRTQGIKTDADEAEALRIAAAYNRDLAATLTPGQIEEMTARLAAIDLFERLLPEAADLSPDEARKIALARAGDAGITEMFDWSESQTPAERERREMQFTNRAAALLGEKRFADFERAQDSNFKTLFNLGKENGLPREAAISVYDMRRLAAEETVRIRSDESLDAAARQARFTEMQEQLQKAAAEALGGEAYRKYLQDGGEWITNVWKL